MAFSRLNGVQPIEELTIWFDATQAEEKMRRRRRMMRSRLISLIITVLILGGIYLWQRDQLTGAQGFVAIYSVVLGISSAWFVVYLILFLRSRRALRHVGSGIALRIGRPGVEVRGVYVPWSEVQSLMATKARLGHSPELTLTRTSGARLSVPFDQIQVRPATLDLTARAYSAGRQGVDLTALDS